MPHLRVGRFAMNKDQKQLAKIILIMDSVVFFGPLVFLGADQKIVNIFIFIMTCTIPITILLVIGMFMKEPKAKEEHIVEEPPIQHTAVDVLESIAALIQFYGEKMPKKHGNWICLDLGGQFFQMDSWNGAIYFMTGKPVYEYWTGFSGDGNKSVYLGMSDKEWRSGDPLPLLIEEYHAYYDKIAAFINEQTVKKRETANDDL